MSIEDKDEILTEFNSLISNFIRSMHPDNLSEIAIEVSKALRALSTEKIDIISDMLCIDYFMNFNERHGFKNILDLKSQFISDQAICNKVIETYMDKYFQSDITIYDFNCLCLSYSEDLDASIDDTISNIKKVLTMTSRFKNDELLNILDHMASACQKNVQYLVYGNSDLYLFDESFLETIVNYNNDPESLFDEFMNSDNFGLDLLTTYFNEFLIDDFLNDRFKNYCDYILENYKLIPIDEKIDIIYSQLIDNNMENDLDDIISIIIEAVDILSSIDKSENDDQLNYEYEDDDRDYQRFYDDPTWGKMVLKYYIVNRISLDEKKDEYINKIDVKFINEIARELLNTFINPEKSHDKHIASIEYYFEKCKDIREFYDINYREYGIELDRMIYYQKRLLLSDYYNNYSDNPIDDFTKENITFIRNNDVETIIKHFNDDRAFAGACIENYIENTISEDNKKGICQDTETLKRINPFLLFEQYNNKTYQKIKK